MTPASTPPETEITPVKTAPQLSAEVERALQQASAEKTRADRVQVVAETFVLALLALLIPVLLDYRYFWSTTDRCLVAALWLLLVAVGIYRASTQWRRVPTSKTIALDLERHLTEAHCEVSTASQYTQAPLASDAAKASPAWLEAELNTALQQRAALHLQRAGSPYRLPLLIGGAVLGLGAALLAVTLTTSPVSRIALQRILLPAGTAHYTEVDVHPGDAETALGGNFDISVQFHGRLPDQAQLEWQEAGGAWQIFPLVQTAPDTFTYQLKNVQQEGTYRIRGNDALSPEYHLATYTPSNIASWQVDIVPPAYTQLPAQQNITGNITTLRGSELKWHLVSTGPLQKADLNFKEAAGKNKGAASSVSLKSEDPTHWSGGMTLKTDQSYHASLSDTNGHPAHDSDTFHLIAVPDAPPVVEINGVDENISAGAQDKIHFNVQADDDIGLADLKVVYQHPGSPDTVVNLYPDNHQAGRHLTRHPVLDLAPYNLQPYDVLIFYAEATDNNTLDGPGITRSHIYFVTIKQPANPNAPDAGGDGGGGGGGQQVNLTQLQHNLISGTGRLPEPLDHSAMADLATSQRQIKDYATQFAEKIADAADAAAALKDAIDAMDKAATALDAADRPKALEEEEKALLGLYKTAHLIPPTSPEAPMPGQPELTIMLDADEAAKQGGQQQKTQAELEKALADAKALEKAQQDQKNNQGDPDAASKQQGLADKARGLAGQLTGMAGNDPNVSHSIGEAAGNAASDMQTAADSLSKGGPSDAVGQAQGQSLADLSKVTAAIEKLLGAMEHKADVSAEEAPPEFEDQLSHYYEKLSHEK